MEKVKALSSPIVWSLVVAFKAELRVRIRLMLNLKTENNEEHQENRRMGSQMV